MVCLFAKPHLVNAVNLWGFEGTKAKILEVYPLMPKLRDYMLENLARYQKEVKKLEKQK